MPEGPPSYKYLFGPVASRRFGLSLGVDLLPFKVCSFDCVYCQLGRTTHQTVERREWVPTADVIAEIEAWVRGRGEADVIALAGSGEPTLHTGFGEVLRAIRGLSAIRTALLTNGSLLHLAEVRRDAAEADVVKVTLSAADESLWTRIHRQAAQLRFTETVDGLLAFRDEYRGQLWLEVMLLGGVNAIEGEVRQIAALAAAVRPDRVQLNTPVRPPAEDAVFAVDRNELERLALLFDPPGEAIGGSHAQGRGDGDVPLAEAVVAAADGAILAMIRRHPCSAADIGAALGLPRESVRNALKRLTRKGLARRRKVGATTCYTAASPSVPTKGDAT